MENTPKDKGMAIVTIDTKDIKKFFEDFAIKITKMEITLDNLSREIEELKNQFNQKNVENGKQDISLAKIKSTCDYRGKLIDELLQFKNKFLFIQIAGNVLTLGLVILIFRLFSK